VAPQSVVRNERVVFDLAADGGQVAVVMVGALAVREIRVSLEGAEHGIVHEAAPVPVARAQELGAFGLGSTVVVLWQGRALPDVRVGQRVRVGERVARR
jgi:phosphatidylserine decarboxylase